MEICEIGESVAVHPKRDYKRPQTKDFAVRATLFFRFIFLHLIVFTLFRLVFWFYFRTDSYETALLAKAFVLGFRFDLRLALVMVLPLVALCWFFSPTTSALAKRVWTTFYAVVGLFLFLFYFLDFGFYGYLNSRMSSVILSFMENPDISLGMMWQAYPLIWIFAGLFALTGLYAFALARLVFAPTAQPLYRLPRWLVSVAFAFVFLAGAYGNLSQYPLRWSDAFFSQYHFISHLSLNPVVYFFETYKVTKNSDFDRKKVQQYYPIIKEYLGSAGTPGDSFQVPRLVKAKSVDKPMNVVVIVMESMAMSKTSLTGNPLDPTPYLAKIASQGLQFTNYYSPAEGTARNMFSIMTAIPDVMKTKESTSTRNPLVVDQKLIANAYKNYQKLYFLGGSASWANIRGIFSHNIDNIEMIEEGSFDRSSTDVWGISDLDLFIEADKRLSQIPANKPFFAVIQSASFHRPYTIPKDKLQFELKPTPEDQLLKAGFDKQEQFDSLRFSDYSLGHFFELAQTRPYFENTIFVITGDHGLPDGNGSNVPLGRHQWELEKYHVPLVIVNPKLFPKPLVDTRMAGHPDLMTSAASLAGVSHVNTTMGRSLFDSEYDKERYAFVYNYYSQIGEFGLIGPRYYYRYDTLKKGQLYDLESQDPTKDLKDELPEVFRRMEDVANAQIEFSRYLLFNNHKDTKPAN